MTERWKHIDGYEDYMVSNLGRVYSLKSHKMLKGAIRSKSAPYFAVRLTSRKQRNIKNVHRLVAEAFIPNLEQKEQVNHIDGNKTNNRVDNLEWVTASENKIHAFRIGLCKTPSNRTEVAIRSRQRKVMVIESGKTYESIVECAKSIDGQHSGVSKCLSGERDHYKGHHFAYVD